VVDVDRGERGLPYHVGMVALHLGKNNDVVIEIFTLFQSDVHIMPFSNDNLNDIPPLSIKYLDVLDLTY